MEKNTDESKDERNKKRKIDDTADDENKKREERLQKSRARSKRYREKKKNENAALVISGLSDADKEKREERLRYDREKSKRYREKKKNEDAAMSMDAAHSSSDSTVSQIKKERQKQNSKRYRDKIRSSKLLATNISNGQNVSHSIHSSQIAGPSTRDVPYLLKQTQVNDSNATENQNRPTTHGEDLSIELKRFVLAVTMVEEWLKLSTKVDFSKV